MATQSGSAWQVAQSAAHAPFRAQVVHAEQLLLPSHTAVAVLDESEDVSQGLAVAAKASKRMARCIAPEHSSRSLRWQNR